MTDAKMKDEFDLENMDGVGPKTAEKLREIGIMNLYDLVITDPVELKETIGGNSTVTETAQMIHKARNILESSGWLNKSFSTAKELLEKRLNIERVQTNSQALDRLLGGGVESDSVTEVYGEFGAGKTQLAHTLSVKIQQSREDGGLDGNCIYVDTENTFRPERIKSIAEAMGMDADEVLARITVARAHNTGHQVLILQHLSEAMTEIEKDTGKKVRLIVIDSMMGNFRPEYIARGQLAGRQQLLNQHIHKLLRICENYHIVGLITNQVSSNPDGFHSEPQATGGNIVAHASTYRLYLKKTGKKRIARFIDSPMHANSECLYTVSEAGIIDADDYKKIEPEKRTEKVEQKSRGKKTKVAKETEVSEPTQEQIDEVQKMLEEQTNEE